MIAPRAIADILGLQDDVHTMAELDDAVARGLSKQSVLRVVTRIAWERHCARRAVRSSLPHFAERAA